MKAFLFFSTLLIPTVFFSQTNMDNINKQDIAPLNNFPGERIPNQSVMGAYTYDSIRPLNEVNDPNNADAFPWISPDGLRIYYTSGANGNQMAFTQRANTSSYFSAPVIVPITVSTPSSYWLSNNELDVYICNNGLYYANRSTTASPFNTATAINLIQPFGAVSYRDVSFNNAQTVLYISGFLSGTYIGNLEFSKTSPATYTYVRTMPAPAGYTVYSGQLSKDELTYFLSASVSMGNNMLYQLTRALPTDSFTVGTFLPIQNINSPTSNNTQPSMSDSLNWVAFVRSSVNSWSANELYIAHKGIMTSVFDPAEIKMNIFPNPVTAAFTIRSDKPMNDVELSIYDVRGQKVRSVKNISGSSITLQRENLAGGLYFIQLTGNDGKTWTKKLMVAGD